MRKQCPRCRGRGYHHLIEVWDFSTICHGHGSYTYFGPLPMKCWRCKGRGYVEVFDGDLPAQSPDAPSP